jgi:phospholipase/carboxylesterase
MLARCLCLLLLLLADGVAEEVDIMAVTPEELGGTDPRGLLADAGTAYEAQDYEAAARAFIHYLRRRPGDASALYNLACCYGLLGAAEPATAFLRAAYRAGFRDLEHIQQDPDFEPVREDAGFQELMDKLVEDTRRRERRAGTPLEVISSQVATVRVVEPEGYDPMERYPLVIGLHGWGDTSENFAGLFLRRGLEQPFLFCVAQAPYAFELGSSVGYSWGLEEPGVPTATTLTAQRLSRQYVLDVLATMTRHYRVDQTQVFLLGFSQGAAQAFDLGMHAPQRFRGVIPVGGWLDPGACSPAEVRQAHRHARFLVCHSPEDRRVEYEACTAAAAFLSEQDIEHTVLSYEGGHSLPEELLRKVLRWIEDPGADLDEEE